MKNFFAFCAMIVVAVGCNSPSPPTNQVPEVERTVNPTIDPKSLSDIRQAINRLDYGELEALRDRDLVPFIEPLSADYHRATDWKARDAIVFLLQDIRDDRLNPLMQHAIDSPTADTRAIAICAIRGDSSLFDSLLVNGFVDSARVDAAISDFRTSNQSHDH